MSVAIGNAVKKGSMIFVYDEKGRQLFTQTGDLHGFTGATVVIKKGALLVTYNDKGRQIATTSALDELCRYLDQWNFEKATRFFAVEWLRS